jgi:type VI secretion system protein VasD
MGRGQCRRLTRGAVLAAGAVLAFMAGCASNKPPPPTPAKAQLTAAPDVNPDSAGRPSPVVVRMFQLRNDGELAAADFFSVWEKEKATLAQSFISREEYVLSPGEKREFDLPLNPETHVIGVVVAYRDIRSARWRALSRAPQKKLKDLLSKEGVTVNVAKDAVTVTVKD